MDEAFEKIVLNTSKESSVLTSKYSLGTHSLDQTIDCYLLLLLADAIKRKLKYLKYGDGLREFLDQFLSLVHREFEKEPDLKDDKAEQAYDRLSKWSETLLSLLCSLEIV